MKWPKTTEKQAAAILEAVDEIDESWEVGLRVVGGAGYFAVSVPAVGDILPRSHEWADGEPTAHELPGTSALRLTNRRGQIDAAQTQRALGLVDSYLLGLEGVAVVLLAGTFRGKGTDPGEILIDEAEVMRVWTM